MARSAHDEQLLQAIADANPSAERLMIVDCRPRVNAELNHAKGKGYEHTTLQYRMARLTFAGVENIHVVRASLKHFLQLLRQAHGAGAPHMARVGAPLQGAPPPPSDPASPSAAPVEPADTAALSAANANGKLERSGWLEHLRSILKGAGHVAHLIAVEGVSVLVHCSDGWDRTPQLTALAQLLLDPLFRTRRGFATLVEKEWLAFGHQFALRCGTVGPLEQEASSPADDQLSPVFVQFVDCVWQLLQQAPHAFEFNGRYLATLLYHTTSCQYSTFLCDCERQRTQLRLAGRARPVWDALAGDEMRNSSYRPTNEVLTPDVGPHALRPWTSFYCRSEGLLVASVAAGSTKADGSKPDARRGKTTGRIKVMLRRKSSLNANV